MLAPIALFVYSRLDHTQQTVAALQANALAADSALYIFADAARRSELEQAVADVRRYIRTIGGFRSVTIIEREQNWGLARSIIDGVSRLCDEFGRVIVVEDDVITAPGFLRFMNEALDGYADSEPVMHVSGYMFPVKSPERLPETFFYRVPTCWGWATWQRAWRHFNPDSVATLSRITAGGQRREFDIEGSFDYTLMLQNQSAGRIDSWAVRWYASIFLRHGLCLHPARSLTNNIGLDNSGEHCAATTLYDVAGLPDSAPRLEQQALQESRAALAAIRAFNLAGRRSRPMAALAWLARNLRRLLHKARFSAETV